MSVDVSLLPDDIWTCVIRFLNLEDLFSMELVSRQFKTLVFRDLHTIECADSSMLLYLLNRVPPLKLQHIRVHWGMVSLNVSTFQKFVNLVELNLNFINQAKDPQLISQLTKLTSLNISKLRVPIVITTLTNLQKLNMKYTEEPFLRCIFTQLSVLTHLKYLNFSDSQIRSNDFKYLTILTNLEHLSLYFGGENIVSNSMRSLLHLSKLTYLNCYYCPCLQDEDVVMFTRLSNLRYLELGHCRLTDNTIRALCLGRMSHLTHLGMPLLITDNSILYLTALHLLSINMWSTAKITSTGFRNLSLLTSLTSISIVSTSNLTQESVSSWSTLTRLQKVNIPHLPQESKV